MDGNTSQNCTTSNFQDNYAEAFKTDAKKMKTRLINKGDMTIRIFLINIKQTMMLSIVINNDEK